MRFEDYVAERCAIAAREAREEGRAEGVELGGSDRQRLISELLDSLTEAGRADELGQALRDDALFDKLLHEFEIDSPLREA